MAHIGMKYPVAATWTEGNKYADGFVLAKAINFTGTPNKNDADLWADDGIAETDKSVKDMGTSLGVDDLSLENQAKLVGRVLRKALRLEPKMRLHSLELDSISVERKTELPALL